MLEFWRFASQKLIDEVISAVAIDEKLPMHQVDKTMVDSMIEQRKEVVVVALDVEQSAWFGMKLKTR